MTTSLFPELDDHIRTRSAFVVESAGAVEQQDTDEQGADARADVILRQLLRQRARRGEDGISCARTSKGRGRPLGKTARAIREFVLDDLTERYDHMTVRQVFYAAEVAGIVAKTEGGYRQVQKQLCDMRRAGLLDWDFIADGTRRLRRPHTSDSAQDYLASVVRSYRRDLWQSQDCRIEVWLEKDALADVIWPVAYEWDVPLMVSRGQSSITFLHTAADAAKAAWDFQGLETFVYALYDHDAGGERAYQAVERDLQEFAGDVPITVERLAVTPEQITEWELPTRPAKAKDPQAKAWGDRPAVELDAIPPDKLKRLVEDAIIAHVDERAWTAEQAVEREEREGLRKLVTP